MNVPQARMAFGFIRGGFHNMTKISGAARGFVRGAGLAAAAMLVLSGAPQQRAEALSLASPATLPVAKYASEGMTIQVRGGHGGHHGGGGFRGGGGFHAGRVGGGGFHAARIGGGYRAPHIYRGAGFHGPRIYGGGYRYGGYRYAYHRPYFHRHRHFHRRFYFTPSYYYHYPRRCRIVWTYWGPRKICRYRHWHRPYYWGLSHRYYW